VAKKRKKARKRKPKLDYIDRACAGLPITDEENNRIIELNRRHRSRCPICSQKGGKLAQRPALVRRLDDLFTRLAARPGVIKTTKTSSSTSMTDGGESVKVDG
jgi:hypothetical protein